MDMFDSYLTADALHSNSGSADIPLDYNSVAVLAVVGVVVSAVDRVEDLNSTDSDLIETIVSILVVVENFCYPVADYIVLYRV